jgi:tRNA pseudouridine38-40 synthase
MVVEYDGTDYFGFQYQPSHPTVQGELEKAIGRITGEHARVHGAGRTDTGVHATGQVINVRLATGLPVENLARALNAVLPRDIAVLDPREVPADFDARHSALARTYRYSVWNNPVRSPLRARFAYHCAAPLDVAAMDASLRPLIGTHDLAAFSGPIAPNRRDPAASATIRRIETIEWGRVDETLTMEIAANGFLPHLVRNIVGAALRVGSGRMGAEEVASLLASKDRRLAPPPAPPSGLCLIRVRYDSARPGNSGETSSDGSSDDNGLAHGYNVDSGLQSEADGPIPDPDR